MLRHCVCAAATCSYSCVIIDFSCLFHGASPNELEAGLIYLVAGKAAKRMAAPYGGEDGRFSWKDFDLVDVDPGKAHDARRKSKDADSIKSQLVCISS